MQEETFGFVYVWFDRKHKRYYIGSHWGREDDDYICSSNNMRMNYKNRPHDFKRRIVARVYTNRDDLFQEEQRWLNMIPRNAFGFQYYNLSPYKPMDEIRGVVNFRLLPSLKTRAERLAKQNKRSLSSWLEIVVEQAIEEGEKGKRK
jgi:predicted HicB family RNase H-like nuclease